MISCIDIIDLVLDGHQETETVLQEKLEYKKNTLASIVDETVAALGENNTIIDYKDGVLTAVFGFSSDDQEAGVAFLKNAASGCDRITIIEDAERDTVFVECSMNIL